MFADDFIACIPCSLYPHVRVRSERERVERCRSEFARRAEAISSYRTPPTTVVHHNQQPASQRAQSPPRSLIARAQRDLNSIVRTCLLALASRSWTARDRSQCATRWSHDTNAAIPLPSRACSLLSSYVQNMG